MSIKIISEKPPVGKLFPVLGQLPGGALTALGLPAIKAEDTGGESTWSPLGWQIVARESIENFYTNLAPFDAYTTNISSDTVLMGDPEEKVFPKVVVNVENSHGKGTLDPTDLSQTSGSSTAIDLELHLVSSSFKVSAATIRDGGYIESKAGGCIDAVMRGVNDYVMGQIKTPGNNHAGTALAAPESVEVPDVEKGWNSGYANKVISELVQPRVNALIVNKTFYGALKAADKEALDLSMIDVDGVYKADYLDELGPNVVGFVSNRRSAAFAMRTPYVMQGMYQSCVQFQHGPTKMPLMMLQWFKPESMVIYCTVMTAVGCKMTAPDFLKLLTCTPSA